MSVPCFSARRCRCDQRRRRGAHVAPCGSRVPADAGAARRARAILEAASRAPSGTNIQPWHVCVATGATRDALAAAHRDPRRSRARRKYVAEYDYYRANGCRRISTDARKVGWDLYGLLNIGRDERRACMHAPLPFLRCAGRIVLHARPRDDLRRLARLRDVPAGVMTAARARGRYCPQAAFVPFHRIVTEHLGIPANEQLVCGMSLPCGPRRDREPPRHRARAGRRSRAFRLKTHDAPTNRHASCDEPAAMHPVTSRSKSIGRKMRPFPLFRVSGDVSC